MKQQAGITLIEMMVGIAILAIVITIGVPSFTAVVRSNRMSTQANEFMTALSLARSEAIKRGTSINITSKSGGSTWQQGWTVALAASGNAVLRDHGAFEGAISTLISNGGNSSYTYNSQGSVDTTDTLNLCFDSGDQGRTITISGTGHVRVTVLDSCP